MRRATAAALVTLAAGLAATAPGGLTAKAGARAGSCVGRGARVLARDAAVGVYETGPRVAGAPRAIWACLAGHSGHMTLLAPTRLNARSSLEGFQLAGHIAAYLERYHGVDTGTTKLVVVDVGARRVLRAERVGAFVDAGILFSERVARFVVTSRGSVAWGSTRSERQAPTVASIYAAPREGPSAQLDSGQAVDAGSLALAGTTLSWTDGGAVRTAAMP